MYVRTILLILICTLFSGCGARLLAPSSVDRLRMDIATIKQASATEVNPSTYSQEAINRLSLDMATTLGISLGDLDNFAAVKSQEWNTDPEQAGKKVEEVIKTPSTPSGAWWALAAAVGTGLAVVALRSIAASGTGGLSQVAGLIGSLLGWTLNPRDKAIRDKLEVAVSRASKDPAFSESAVGKELSEVMTPEEKIYIKRKKAKKNYENAKRA